MLPDFSLCDKKNEGGGGGGGESGNKARASVDRTFSIEYVCIAMSGSLP